MADYIECRNCESPDCKGCNIKNLETMLKNGKFECLMNENRCVNPSADVAQVRHGRWIRGGYFCGESEFICSVCGESEWRTSSLRMKYCMFCGSKMDLEQFGKDEMFQESKGENENE